MFEIFGLEPSLLNVVVTPIVVSQRARGGDDGHMVLD
jgi:hypothetical protein